MTADRGTGDHRERPEPRRGRDAGSKMDSKCRHPGLARNLAGTYRAAAGDWRPAPAALPGDACLAGHGRPAICHYHRCVPSPASRSRRPRPGDGQLGAVLEAVRADAPL